MHVLDLENQSHHSNFPSSKLDAQARDLHTIGIFGKLRLCTTTFILNTWKDSAWIMGKNGPSKLDVKAEKHLEMFLSVLAISPFWEPYFPCCHERMEKAFGSKLFTML